MGQRRVEDELPWRSSYAGLKWDERLPWCGLWSSISLEVNVFLGAFGRLKLGLTCRWLAARNMAAMRRLPAVQPYQDTNGSFPIGRTRTFDPQETLAVSTI
ncbi:MAG: hypothetical protein KDA51_10305 [Planctomycetales bacterium]|nr:hypothetical protein [Planctomycetales bacterium]